MASPWVSARRDEKEPGDAEVVDHSAKKDAKMFPPITTLCPFDPRRAIDVLNLIDERFLVSLSGVADSVPELGDDDRNLVVSIFDHMMLALQQPHLKRRYGYNRADHMASPLVFGEPVPSYYANVSDGSMYQRKRYSIAGLRNLVLYGPVIYVQLRATQFAGNPLEYAEDEGLSLMRTYTGNVVDLDTTVLRCSCKATLNAINLSNKHKGLPMFKSPQEFSSSSQAEEIAVHCSIELLNHFALTLNMDEAKRRRRNISLEQIRRPIPVAATNTDRGRHPVWHYINVGQDSFHANVPHLDDVNGALLKAPYHCAMLWATIHAVFSGEMLQRKVDEFFEDCIADSCFNMKWKAIEAFSAKLRHEGTITDVLEKTQAEAQATFTAAFFAADDGGHSTEVAEMWRLVEGKVGREASTGKVRPITPSDVARWVVDPSVSI
jgi:hypothetical protein